MAKTKVKLNISGFNELRRSAEMQAGLSELAQSVAAKAGEGYSSDLTQYPSRSAASVYADSIEAKRECARSAGNPILEALQS